MIHGIAGRDEHSGPLFKTFSKTRALPTNWLYNAYRDGYSRRAWRSFPHTLIITAAACRGSLYSSAHYEVLWWGVEIVWMRLRRDSNWRRRDAQQSRTGDYRKYAQHWGEDPVFPTAMQDGRTLVTSRTCDRLSDHLAFNGHARFLQRHPKKGNVDSRLAHRQLGSDDI
jgi:hypothetical protein